MVQLKNIDTQSPIYLQSGKLNVGNEGGGMWTREVEGSIGCRGAELWITVLLLLQHVELLSTFTFSFGVSHRGGGSGIGWCFLNEV